MPTVWKQNGFEFVIRTNEPRFEPPHVHVIKAGGEVKIVLGSDREPPEIVGIWMRDKDAVAALLIVAEKQDYFLGAWRGIHG
jgi:Domain of unknown function (DUF4160)